MVKCHQNSRFGPSLGTIECKDGARGLPPKSKEPKLLVEDSDDDDTESDGDDAEQQSAQYDVLINESFTHVWSYDPLHEVATCLCGVWIGEEVRKASSCAIMVRPRKGRRRCRWRQLKDAVEVSHACGV